VKRHASQTPLTRDIMPDAGADIARNRALWTVVNAQFTDEDAYRAWAAKEPTWGLFRVPERDLGVLGDVAGLDVLELGCGTAYLSGWMARRGARPVGVDLTPEQLATAARCQQRFGLAFPLVEADAEHVPLVDESFDLVVSEYGASVWCDPDRWVAEAARLLRPGGRLVFVTNSVLATLCVPAEEGFAQERLLRPQRGLHRVEWPGGGVEFHPSHGEWIRVLSVNGFVVQALHELYAPADAATHQYYDIATAQWASQWPVEDLWAAHLASRPGYSG
jgi:SAM-dependent methyltransferase